MLRLGQGYISFFFFFSCFYWNFKIIGRAFIQSKNIFQKDTDTPHYPPPLSLTQICMCVCVLVCVSPQMCMWWVGYMYMPPRHLVAPTGSANATVWVTLRQFAPHHLIFVPKCYFFTGSVSAYGLPPSCCCFHHYCWGFFLIFFPPRSVPLVLLDRLKLL